MEVQSWFSIVWVPGIELRSSIRLDCKLPYWLSHLAGPGCSSMGGLRGPQASISPWHGPGCDRWIPLERGIQLKSKHRPFAHVFIHSFIHKYVLGHSAQDNKDSASQRSLSTSWLLHTHALCPGIPYAFCSAPSSLPSPSSLEPLPPNSSSVSFCFLSPSPPTEKCA